MLWPLVLRPTSDGLRDGVSPYGYSGPLRVGGDGGFRDDAWAEGSAFLAAQGLVSLFVRLHPLLDPIPPSRVGTSVRHGDIVILDLAKSEDEQWREVRKSHRSGIRRAERAGCTVEVGDLDGLSELVRLYRSTMSRRGAAAYYQFTDDYFDGVRRHLRGRITVALARLGDEVVAASMLLTASDIVQAHLSGWDDRFARIAPMKLLDHASIRWARAHGYRWFSFGGGLGGSDDSIMEYKAGFSDGRAPFHTVRVVLKPERYRQLVKSTHPNADPNDLTTYFPLYRAP